MTEKRLLLLTILSYTSYIVADSASMQIPEGKITDYHCIHPDITPAAGPRVIDGCDLFVAGDYLYWTARESNLEYAATGYSNSYASSVRSGTTKKPKFGFDSGFKATLGWSFSHDCWDTLATYTWFQSNHNTHAVSAHYDEGLSPYFTPYISYDYFYTAHTDWNVHFNTIDWELGRNCYISKYLSLRPFAGLKGTWQTQNFDNFYKGIAEDHHFIYRCNNTLSSIGMGVRLGTNTTWHLSESWSLFGDFSLSALWQLMKTSRKDHYKVSGADSVTPIQTAENNHQLTPVLELCLGVRKDTWFHDDRIHIGLQAGWEEQIWWDQNQFSLSAGTVRGGNLFLQGLTVRLRADF